MKLKALLASVLIGSNNCAAGVPPPRTHQTEAEIQFPVVSTPLPAIIIKKIGIMGCSMTQDTGEGYQMLGGDQIWAPLPYMSSGALNWLIDGEKTAWNWQSFYDTYAAQGADVIWWQLCAGGDPAHQTYEDALIVLNRIKETGVQTVYVSPPPTYLPISHTCNIAGDGAYEDMLAIVEQLVSDGLALRGPDIGQVAFPDQTRDQCHANTEGKKVEGQQLMDWINTLN